MVNPDTFQTIVLIALAAAVAIVCVGTVGFALVGAWALDWISAKARRWL